MGVKIFCTKIAPQMQGYYLSIKGKKYFLFQQSYRTSNKLFFQNGVSINEVHKFSSKHHSTSVRRTLAKIPIHLRSFEKEYGLIITKQTQKMQQKKNIKLYKRKPFLWKQVKWDIA